jgi:hypothetical protein
MQPIPKSVLQIVESSALKDRFLPLARRWLPADGPCPLVVNAEAAAPSVTLAHYAAGVDAQYVLATRDARTTKLAKRSAVTISYTESVEGTAIIYDATDEVMQGKARPFATHIEPDQPRLFAILPFQIEGAALEVERSRKESRVRIHFLDGRGEVVHAALPFELVVASDDGQRYSDGYHATDCQGFWSGPLPVLDFANVQVGIRSLLSGMSYALSPL